MYRILGLLHHIFFAILAVLDILINLEDALSNVIQVNTQLLILLLICNLALIVVIIVMFAILTFQLEHLLKFVFNVRMGFI